MRRKTMWIGLALCLGLCLSSCGQKEADTKIKSAEQAIQDANDAGARQYAPEQYVSAEDALTRAKAQYGRLAFKKAQSEAQTAEAQALAAKDKALRIKEEEEALRRQKEEEERRQRELEAQQTEEKPEPPALADIYFPFDSDALNDAAKAELQKIADYMAANPKATIEIEGHCDERGTEEYNMALGTRRAKAAFDYLVSLGADPARIRTISYGEMKPVDAAHHEAAWAKNRRAHINLWVE